MTRGIPNPTTRNAAEGTYAHEIAATALKGIQPPARWLGKRRRVDEFEIECTKEMVEAVDFYVNTLQDELQPGDQKFVEVDLTKALRGLYPALGGTADFMRYRPATKHLRVVDLKFGIGVLVEVEDNVQAKTYALGALLELNQPCSEVTVTIIQPRAEHPDGRVRDWTFPSADLIDFAADLVTGAEAAEKPDAPLNPGEKQCRWCSAKPICPALEKQQHGLMVQEFADLPSLTPERLAAALVVVPAVKARIKAIEEAAYTLATQGQEVPGFKLVDKRPTRKWKSEGEVAVWAQDQALDLWAPRELLSPAQAEKKLAEALPRGAKKEAAAKLAPFIESVSSGHALVPIADDRPQIQRITAADFAV